MPKGRQDVSGAIGRDQIDVSDLGTGANSFVRLALPAACLGRLAKASSYEDGKHEAKGSRGAREGYPEGSLPRMQGLIPTPGEPQENIWKYSVMDVRHHSSVTRVGCRVLTGVFNRGRPLDAASGPAETRSAQWSPDERPRRRIPLALAGVRRPPG